MPLVHRIHALMTKVAEPNANVEMITKCFLVTHGRRGKTGLLSRFVTMRSNA